MRACPLVQRSRSPTTRSSLSTCLAVAQESLRDSPLSILGKKHLLAATARSPVNMRASKNASPLGDHEMLCHQVDGVPVASAPVVPAPDGGSGRRRLLQQSSTSVFSVTIIAPSTPGVHTIIGMHRYHQVVVTNCAQPRLIGGNRCHCRSSPYSADSAAHMLWCLGSCAGMAILLVHIRLRGHWSSKLT